MNNDIIKKSINTIWDDVWISQGKAGDPIAVFNNRLFIEGYPVFKSHIPKNIKKILDVGSGTGRYGIKFSQDFPDSKVTITDISDESIDFISRLAERTRTKNISIQKENVLNMSFSDNEFDVVFCDVVIQHLPNYKDAIEEMIRVLKPGGRIIISVNNYWNFPHTIHKFILGKKYMYGYEKSYTKKELRELYKQAGLKTIAEDGFYFAYGIFRLKYINNIFKLIGRIANRTIKFFDKFTNRWISKNLGFEILIVGEK